MSELRFLPDLTPDAADPWPGKPQSSFIAVHLLLCAMADHRGEVEDAGPRLAALLKVDRRTVERHLRQLRNEGRLSGPSNRPQLIPEGGRPRVAVLLGDRPRVADLPQGDPYDPGIQDCDPTIARAIPRSLERSQDRNLDPGVAEVAALIKRSDAKRSDASLENWIDRILEKAASYVPRAPDGRLLAGRRVDPANRHTRSSVALLLGVAPAEYGPAVLATVERFIALCEADPDQRRFWSERMFDQTIAPGRRKSAWAALCSSVDRQPLTAPKVVSAAPTKGRYGQGDVSL